nr:MAG TPA: hypothetical protein [Caudoviricetes sp.]
MLIIWLFNYKSVRIGNLNKPNRKNPSPAPYK